MKKRNIRQKNRTPSQRRPYKNTYVFMILKILYACCSDLSIFPGQNVLTNYSIFSKERRNNFACKFVIAFD